MQWRAFGETLVTLLVIMDPVGNTPIFVSLTRRMTSRERARAAIGSVVAATGLIVGFGLFGRVILDYLHVSLESLSIAGGLLLLVVALEMLRGSDMTPAGGSGGTAGTGGNSVALVPLATPLLAGPSAIAAVMVLTRRFSDAPGRVAVVSGILVAALAIGLVLLIAGRLSRLVPIALLEFLARVFGLLLSAIAVQLIVDGVQVLAKK